MKIKDIGEFGLIERFSRKFFGGRLPDGYVGIGDDCAVLPPENKKETLISTDMLIENVHFIRSEIGGLQLGKKSLAVNLSDLASSGADPCGSFLSIGVPEETDVEFLDDFFKGYAEMSAQYSCPLLGGDTVKSPDLLVINVTVVGKADKKYKKLRSMAKNGDVVCVTGFLGDSAAGLHYLLNKGEKRPAAAKYFISRHHSPEPRIKEGLFLSALGGVHAMTDLSDGLSSDLKHIMKLSDVSAVIELDKLPLSERLRESFSLNQAYNFALCGGEDYELLLTVDSRKFAGINSAFIKRFNRPLYAVGKITEGFADEISFTENCVSTNGFSNGYDHFSA